MLHKIKTQICLSLLFVVVFATTGFLPQSPELPAVPELKILQPVKVTVTSARQVSVSARVVSLETACAFLAATNLSSLQNTALINLHQGRYCANASLSMGKLPESASLAVEPLTQPSVRIIVEAKVSATVLTHKPGEVHAAALPSLVHSLERNEYRVRSEALLMQGQTTNSYRQISLKLSQLKVYRC